MGDYTWYEVETSGPEAERCKDAIEYWFNDRFIVEGGGLWSMKWGGL